MITMGIFRIFKIGNLRKTYYYFKKNGLKNAFYAAAERILDQMEKNISTKRLRRKRWPGKGRRRGNTLVCSASLFRPMRRKRNIYGK